MGWPRLRRREPEPVFYTGTDATPTREATTQAFCSVDVDDDGSHIRITVVVDGAEIGSATVVAAGTNQAQFVVDVPWLPGEVRQ